MTNEEAIIEIKDASDSEVRYGDIKHHHDEVIKRVAAFDMAIQALERQQSDDCISRQEAISAIQDEYYAHAVGIDIVDIIAHLPPVQPTRPTGKWIKMPLIEAGQTYSHECSLCGRRILITDVGLSEFPYCHCGARMEESEDKE